MGSSYIRKYNALRVISGWLGVGGEGGGTTDKMIPGQALSYKAKLIINKMIFLKLKNGGRTTSQSYHECLCQSKDQLPLQC